MAIPDYQSCMLPLLKFAADNTVHKLPDAVAAIAEQFHLTDEEKNELLPSGTQAVIANRIGWARTYLKKAGLLADPQRGCFQITDRGRDFLKKSPSSLTTKDLRRFTEFTEFENKSNHKDRQETTGEEELSYNTPEEALEYGYQKLSENLADDLLEMVLHCSPAFFERLVVDLLVRMGYGGSFTEAAQVVGRSGDEGIDGIIKEDKLGLDAIYIQAKRWEAAVGRPEIQKFAGALLGQKADKGVFITTSTFSREARDYARSVDRKIVLIDGRDLARLMIEFNVGISTVRTYELKRIDSDYFQE
jgi:restriction system protein